VDAERWIFQRTIGAGVVALETNLGKVLAN